MPRPSPPTAGSAAAISAAMSMTSAMSRSSGGARRSSIAAARSSFRARSRRSSTPIRRCRIRAAWEEIMSSTKDWTFSHDAAASAEWTPGLREIFEYRDLGIKEGTKGDYVAHLIRRNDKKVKDDVQQWHAHDCTFQMVYV